MRREKPIRKPKGLSKRAYALDLFYCVSIVTLTVVTIPVEWNPRLEPPARMAVAAISIVFGVRFFFVQRRLVGELGRTFPETGIRMAIFCLNLLLKGLVTVGLILTLLGILLTPVI